MSDHIFERSTVFKIAHNDADSPIILCYQFHTAVLDSIVIHDKGADLDRQKHAKWYSKEVLHSTLSNKAKLSLVCNHWLRIIWLEDYLEIGDNYCAL